MIVMTSRDWRPIVEGWESSRPGRQNVRLLVHLAFRMDTVDEQNITSEVLKEKREAYEDELTAQAANVGCRDRRGIMDNKTLKICHEQSVQEGQGIVNTYNYDLAMAINAIHGQIPSANRNTYAKYLGQWHESRASWKTVQISLHNHMEWRSRAQTDFMRMNNIQGYARLMPATRASCDICKAWIRRGKVPLDEARRIIEQWPLHLNCIHSWEIKPLGDMRCDELWVGQEPESYRIKEMAEPMKILVRLRKRVRIQSIQAS